MKIIILAAGKGERLLPLTKNMPKALVPIFGKPILEYQLNVIKKIGLLKIVIVKGYQEDKINYENIKYYVNKKYSTTNMVETLFCAIDEMNEPFVIAYGDIIYGKKILEKLISDQSEISVVIDKKWKDLWKIRSDDPLGDTESLDIKDGKIVSIGQEISSLDEPCGQYIGLMKFQRDGISKLKIAYKTLKEKSENNKGYYKNGKKFEQMYMTDLLQQIIDLGYQINPVFTAGDWLEVDTLDDHKKYSELYSKNKLSDLIKIDEILEN